MEETWYVMEDGSVGDPREIGPDKDGLLRHKDGRAVKYASYGPVSRGGVDPEAERGRGKQKAAPAAESSRATRDMKPEEPSARTSYKTR